MKSKYTLILVLAIIAIVNATYLSWSAHRMLTGVQVSLGCDINPTFSCSNVIIHPDTMIAGIPFPYLALIVYPIISLLAIWGIIRTSKACKNEYDAKQTSETKGVCDTTNDRGKEVKGQSQTKFFQALPARIINWIALAGICFNAYILTMETLFIHAYCILCLICVAIIITIFGVSWTMRK